MRLAGMIACVAMAVAGVGGAYAQTACGQIGQLMKLDHAGVKALQGAKSEENKEAIKYVAKAKVAGFSACSLSSDKAINDISDYWEHHLWCDGEAVSSEAATQTVESLWACLKDTFTERAPGEAWMDGKYRVIRFDGEAPLAGRSAGLVDFGETEYARMEVEKAYDTSDEYDLHIYWQFTK